jgi:hypothetical protein
MKRFSVFLFVAILTAFAGAVPAEAQTGSAVISGQVTDPFGALVPGATVVVANVRTGIERIVVTNDAGLFTVESLVPGEYQIIVEKSGFKRFIRSGVILQVDQRSRQDVAMEVGDVAEMVEVEASAVQFLGRETSEISQVIRQAEIAELPLNTRFTFELITLSAGVTSTSRSFFKNVGIDLSLSGQRPSTNNYLIDGMDNIEFMSNAPNNTVQPDAVAEFNVLLNSFSAEYGRTTGGVVSMQMRSGTNDFHGTLFHFLRNEVFDATDFFTNLVGGDKNPFRFNQFGGTLGGPIVRNRTFFFVGYQGTRSITRFTSRASVPPLAWREGDFSDLLAQGIQIYDPTDVIGMIDVFPERAPFPGNIIPFEKQNPAGRAVLSLYPAPNRPGLIQNYVQTLGTDSWAHDTDLKIDHQFNSNHSIFGRLNLTNFRLNNDPLFGDEAGGGAFPRQETDNLNMGIGYTWIISPTTLNEFRFGILRRKNDVLSSGFGLNLNNELGIPGLNLSEESSGLAWICPTGFDCLGGQPFFPQLVTINSRTFSDKFSVVRGRHSMRMGANFNRRQLDLFQAGFPRGLFLTGSFMTAQVGVGGNAVASLLVGYPFFRLRDVLDHTIDQRSWEMGFFFQDDYRVNSRLTLNMGIRYDYFMPPVERNDLQANFNMATGGMDIAGQGGVPRGLINPDRNNFAPRIGFAYSLTRDQRTVLRGGYGISYIAEHTALATLDRSTYNIPFYFQQSIFESELFTPTLSLSDGMPAPPPPNPAAPFGKVIYRDPNLRDAYVQFWSLNVQRELTSTLLLDVAYSATRGVKLLSIRNPNQPPPGATQVFPISPAIGLLFTMESRANSAYDGLQVRVDKRWSHGHSFLTTYTWSKSLDNSVGYWPDSGRSQLPMDSRDITRERGLSDWDIRQRLTLNYIWQLPFGHGQRYGSDMPSILDHILGGWQWSGILIGQAGTPFSPLISVNQANTANGGNQRANQLRDGALSSSERSRERWFDVTAYALPQLFTFGNAGRNTLIGPRMLNFNMGVAKSFQIREQIRLQFRSEFFNLFNRAHFGLPNEFIDLPQGGTINSLVHPPRQVQFGLKLVF